jgi:hypothetical protein
VSVGNDVVLRSRPAPVDRRRPVWSPLLRPDVRGVDHAP